MERKKERKNGGDVVKEAGGVLDPEHVGLHRTTRSMLNPWLCTIPCADATPKVREGGETSEQDIMQIRYSWLSELAIGYRLYFSR